MGLGSADNTEVEAIARCFNQGLPGKIEALQLRECLDVWPNLDQPMAVPHRQHLQL